VPLTASMESRVLVRVFITSEGFVFIFVWGVKIEAKASGVTVLGKLLVRDIGRWREKKSAAPISDECVSNNELYLKMETPPYLLEQCDVYWAR